MTGSLLQAALLGHASVRDCVVIEHPPVDGRSRAIAYVVPESPLSPERLDAHIRATVPHLELPDAYVPVTAIPLDDQGGVDGASLATLPVIDESVVAGWQARLANLPGVEDAAVILDEHPPTAGSVHVATVVPGWARGGETVAAAPATDEMSAPAEAENDGPLAESMGAGLEPGPDSPQTLGASLLRAATENPDTGILYIPADGVPIPESYAELHERAGRIGAGLREAGVEPGTPVLMQLAGNSDFLGAFWGCVAAGAVPVPVGVPASYKEDSGAIEKLVNAWTVLDRALVIADRAGAAQLKDVARRKRLEGFRTAPIEDLAESENGDVWHQATPDDVALMLLTSGTTGAPKAVMQSHRALLGRSLATQIMNELTSRDISFSWMPFDHVAGLVYFHLRDVFLGCRQLHTPTELVLQQPTRWLDWLDQHRVTVTFAPNFAYALVNDLSDEVATGTWDLGSVRYFMNAGEAIVAATARRFLQILEPHGLAPTAMLPAWGMSETCSAVTFGTSFTVETTHDDDHFVDVGDPIPGFDMRIVDGEGRVVRGETEGALEVRGVPVTSGYYQNPEENAQSFTSDGWFRTGDLAFLRDGKLTITGRMKDVIIVNGINYYSHEIEKVVDDLDGVSPTLTAACAVRDPGVETDQLTIFFHSEITDDWGLGLLLKEIRQAVVHRIGILPRFLIPVAEEEIPRTGIGKIQRPLLRKRFEAGDFEDPRRRVECLVAGPDTVPPWFFRPTWVRREATPGSEAKGDCLVMLDSTGLGAAVRSELERRGYGVVGVKAGSRFEKLEDSDFQIEPADPSHFQRVLSEASASGARIRSVVDLWPYEGNGDGQAGADSVRGAQRLGAQAVLHLAQALNQAHDDGPCRLLAVTRRLYGIGDDEAPSHAHAAIPGLTRTVPQEMPWLESATVDLTGEDHQAEASHVVDELESHSLDAEAAYRDGQRWVRRLEPVAEAEFGGSEPPFRRNGLYLITGGLGGIGREIASYLLTEFEARLLLVGRRNLPPESEGAAGSPEDQERLKALRELGELPGEVEYRAVDVCDAGALGQAVEAAEDRWSAPLAGVVHLAGSFRERLLQDESADSFAAAVGAKVNGTENLCQLVRERTGAVFMAFSSVNAFFGGYGAGAYAAANAFLEGAVENLVREHGIDAYCFAWSLWDEVGMSRGYALKEAAPRRGFHLIPPLKGFNSFLGALYSGERNLLIGLDGNNPNIRPLIVPARPASRRLIGYVAPREAAADRAPPVQDRFGAQTRCEIRPVARIPRGAAGEVGWAQLLGEAGAGGGDSPPPSTDMERLIASAWKEVLGLDTIGINENFFDLGADSVTMARAQLEIRRATDVELKLTTLYEYPTVQLLAEHFAPSEGGKSLEPEVDESERRGADRRERMLRRRKRSGDDGGSVGEQDA